MSRCDPDGVSAHPPATWDPPFVPFAVEALPPLPPLSPAGEHLALTHKSALDSSRPKSKIEAFELELASNRRVEWLGDSVLGWFVAQFIEQRWPTSVSSTVSVRPAIPHTGTTQERQADSLPALSGRPSSNG